MKLIRWSPFDEISTLRGQIDRIFEPLITHTDEESDFSYALPVEVVETPQHYQVRVMVAGVDPEKIELQGTQKGLTVAYDTTPRELEKDEIVHLKQFKYGKFSRQLSFPEAIDADKINAKYEYGILEVALPKAEKSKGKTIEIKVNSR